jgi:hypothetical protein
VSGRHRYGVERRDAPDLSNLIPQERPQWTATPPKPQWTPQCPRCGARKIVETPSRIWCGGCGAEWQAEPTESLSTVECPGLPIVDTMDRDVSVTDSGFLSAAARAGARRLLDADVRNRSGYGDAWSQR